MLRHIQVYSVLHSYAEEVSYELFLAYEPPYDWVTLMRYLKGRAVTGVDEVEGLVYRRVMALSGAAGWLTVEPEPEADRVRLTLSPELAPLADQVAIRVAHLFDLGCRPAEVARVLGELEAGKPGLRVPGALDGFELAVRAVLGQQISVAAATTLSGRFATAFGTPIVTPFPRLTTVYPRAEAVAGRPLSDISQLGILAARAQTILSIAEAIASGKLTLEPGTDAAAAIKELQTIKGIGPWTAHYVAMRALGYRDAFLHTDLGVYKALNEFEPKRVLALAEVWRPYRAYALMQLWHQLPGV